MANAMTKVAEKSVVANIVSGVVGGVIGSCTTKFINDTLENIAPEPKNVGMKVVYGIGCYAIGTIVGGLVAEKMAEEAQELNGAILTCKATLNQVLNAANESTETEVEN